MAKQRAEDKDRIASLESQLEFWKSLSWCAIRMLPNQTARIPFDISVETTRPGHAVVEEASEDDEGFIYRALTGREVDDSTAEA